MSVSVGEAIRTVREAEGLGVRELARRAGVSAAQVSRIERGEVRTPNWNTLWSIAEALGRPRAALEYLARTSPHGGAEELLLGTAAARDGNPDLARDWPDERLWASESSAEGSFAADETLEAYAADVFIKGGGLAALMMDGDTLREDAVEALTHIAGMWPGLTEDRRAAVVRYVDEQSILSEIDRKKRA